MYELKKIGRVLTSKSVLTGPSSYEKRIYRAAVSQRLRNTVLDHSAVAAVNTGCSKTLVQTVTTTNLFTNSVILKCLATYFILLFS